MCLRGSVSAIGHPAIFKGVWTGSLRAGVLARVRRHCAQADEVGGLLEPQLLYGLSASPWRPRSSATHVSLSRIGFLTATCPHDAVATDLKLERSRDGLPVTSSRPPTIILDGENAWEQYPNNGNDFLRYLYGTLQTDERFETVRVSDFLDKTPANVELPNLHTGSWIDATLGVWIGEPAHAKAWSALERTRRFAQEQWGALRYMPKSVRQPLMVAEGSDCFLVSSSRTRAPRQRVLPALPREPGVVCWYAGAEPPDDIRTSLMDPTRLAAVVGRGGAMLPGAAEKYGAAISRALRDHRVGPLAYASPLSSCVTMGTRAPAPSVGVFPAYSRRCVHLAAVRLFAIRGARPGSGKRGSYRLLRLGGAMALAWAPLMRREVVGVDPDARIALRPHRAAPKARTVGASNARFERRRTGASVSGLIFRRRDPS